MEFKQWLNEIAELSDADTSGVDFEPIEDEYERLKGYRHVFKHNNQQFRVTFNVDEPVYANRKIPDSYQINFHGPNGYRLTGLAGSMAAGIYSKLLLAVKKFLEIHEVNAFTFSANHSFMNLIYDRFYKQFLQKTFLRVDDGLFILKEYLRIIYNSLDSKTKEKLYRKIIGNNRGILQGNKEIANVKIAERKIRLNMQKYLGNFFYDENRRPVYIYRFPPIGVGVFVMKISPHASYLYNDNLDLKTISTNATPTEQEIQKFLLIVSRSRDFISFLTPEEEQTLDAVMKRHGIAFQKDTSVPF